MLDDATLLLLSVFNAWSEIGCRVDMPMFELDLDAVCIAYRSALQTLQLAAEFCNTGCSSPAECS